MGGQSANSAILADRGTVASDAVRGLLETEFDSVYLVADLRSLREGIELLAPRLVVIDQSLGVDALPSLVDLLRPQAPGTGLIMLTTGDQAVLARSILAAGAQAVVLKRSAGTDLFEAIAAIGRGEPYASPGFGTPPPDATVAATQAS